MLLTENILVAVALFFLLQTPLHFARSRGAEFRRTGTTHFVVNATKSGGHFDRRVRRALPVLLLVRGDDVVAGVLELVAHETPGEDMRFGVSLQVDAQE